MVMGKIEKTFGLPRISQVTEALKNLPDERQLRELYRLLTLAEKVSEHAPDLNEVVQLIQELNALPIEKLEKIEGLLKQIHRIMTKAPQELLAFLSSLKE
jgi:hypothetical protein